MNKTSKPKLLTIEDCEKLANKNVRQLYKQYVNPGLENILYSFGAGEILIDHAEGVWMYTKDGRKILDVSGGIGVLTLGHNHPRILETRIRYQQMKRMEVHKTIFSPYQAGLSHNLAQLLPGDLNYPFFCNSGAEAVEGAVKLAYKYHKGKRQHILHADISFHGKLLGTGGMTNSQEKEFKFPTIPGIKVFDYKDIESIKTLVADLRQPSGESDIYALIIEPFNAITLTYLSNEYLQSLRKLCDEHNICLIVDEVFCGWCKTGNYFRFMDSGIIPDIITTSKSLGGGKSSISAYISRKPILIKAYGDVPNATLHTTTYNGFGEECATAIEAINIMVDEDFPAKCRALEQMVVEKGKVLMKKYPEQIEEIRGAGAHHGIFPKRRDNVFSSLLQSLPLAMTQDKNFLNKIIVASLVDWLFKKHDIFTFFNNNRDVGVLFSPSLVIEKKEVDYFFNAMDETFDYGVTRIIGEFIKNKFLKVLG